MTRGSHGAGTGTGRGLLPVPAGCDTRVQGTGPPSLAHGPGWSPLRQPPSPHPEIYVQLPGWTGGLCVKPLKESE